MLATVDATALVTVAGRSGCSETGRWPEPLVSDNMRNGFEDFVSAYQWTSDESATDEAGGRDKQGPVLSEPEKVVN